MSCHPLRSARQRLFALLPVLGLGLVLRAVPGPELVRNGGFEEGFTATGLATAWQDDSAWADLAVAYAAESQTAAGGRSAQRITCTRYAHGFVSLRQGGLPIEAGHDYRIRLAVRGEAESPLEIQLRRAGPPYTLYASRHVSIAPGWTRHDFTVTASASDPAALLHLRFASTGTLWLDDVSVVDLGPTAQALALTPPDGPIPAAYFGLHTHRDDRFPTVPFGSWRLWDAGLSWPHLQPRRGEWDFRRLDARVEQAAQHGVEILLPLGLSPKWASARPDELSAYNRNQPATGRDTGWAAEPASLEDWRTYVRTVAERYRGRIRHYEIWNEVNEDRFFSGTIDQLVELQAEAWRILKEVDPANQVLAPSVVGNSPWFARLLRRDIGRWCDAYTYHFYNFNAPELFVPVAQELQRLIADAPGATRPLWNTEAGWYVSSAQMEVTGPFNNNREAFILLDQPQAGAWLARAFILHWALGVPRSYLYAWDNGRMGLCEPDGTPKPAAQAFAEIQTWLTGKRMISCRRETDGIWTAGLERPDGRREAIVWSPDRPARWSVPAEFGPVAACSLDGRRETVAGGEVPVSFSPRLITPAE